MNLEELPPSWKTIQWLSHLIRYENADGVHTYHQCECNRQQTRAGVCSICLNEALEELQTLSKQEQERLKKTADAAIQEDMKCHS